MKADFDDVIGGLALQGWQRLAWAYLANFAGALLSVLAWTWLTACGWWVPASQRSVRKWFHYCAPAKHPCERLPIQTEVQFEESNSINT